MNNIVILGDSLAFNRPDSLNDNQRWPALLMQEIRGFKITNLSMGSSTSSKFKKLDHSLFSEKDTLIVQIGIVDCAPRLFTKFENRVISKLPLFISKKVISFFKKKRVQDQSRVYIKPGKFESNLLGLFSKYEHINIVYLKILPASNKFISSNPTVATAINQYNLILDNCAKKFSNVHLVNFGGYNIDEYTLEDGYHLNAAGHKLVFDHVVSLIKKINKAG